MAVGAAGGVDRRLGAPGWRGVAAGWEDWRLGAGRRRREASCHDKRLGAQGGGGGGRLGGQEARGREEAGEPGWEDRQAHHAGSYKHRPHGGTRQKPQARRPAADTHTLRALHTHRRPRPHEPGREPHDAPAGTAQGTSRAASQGSFPPPAGPPPGSTTTSLVSPSSPVTAQHGPRPPGSGSNTVSVVRVTPPHGP